ncbi:MAG: sigma-70 family RNA polymerase sigma factor [Bacteriovoracaceae bacterium]|nr:sigma-70 family RNA polymerase sigma factor [Bacteriovoracaceae bacterium]
MKTTKCSDEDLMKALQQGDPSALVALYERHANKVWSYLKKRVPSDRVDDLFQDCFVKIVEKKNMWGNQPFVLWLYVLLRNIVIDFYRDEKVEKRMLERISFNLETISGDRFDEIVSKLSPDSSKLIKEYFNEGLSYKELSDRYKMSEVSLRKRLSRAINILKKGESHER